MRPYQHHTLSHWEHFFLAGAPHTTHGLLPMRRAMNTAPPSSNNPLIKNRGTSDEEEGSIYRSRVSFLSFEFEIVLSLSLSLSRAFPRFSFSSLLSRGASTGRVIYSYFKSLGFCFDIWTLEEDVISALGSVSFVFKFVWLVGVLTRGTFFINVSLDNWLRKRILRMLFHKLCYYYY